MLKQTLYGRCSCGRKYAKQVGNKIIQNLSGCNPFVQVGGEINSSHVHWLPNGKAVSGCRNLKA